MDHLYAPWRDTYFTEKREGCVFCHISQNSDMDEELGVLYRDKTCFVVMNRYPYTPGHFMVIPHQHTDKLEELSPEAWQHISLQAQNGVKLLQAVFDIKAVNLGMNIGADAGAGIAEHLHYHVVPRWYRDTNFITTIGQARVFSTDFDAIYKKLLERSEEFFGGDA
jgi:diadenosine tetraphosphate (Ap4A) HIT family hydrolase